MRVLSFMEHLLMIEAEVKYLLAAKDRSYERSLHKELLTIIEEAEFFFGPRNRAYELSVPRITECFTAQTAILRPLRKIRIFLSCDSTREPWIASLELAHEAVHALSPVPFAWGGERPFGWGGPTILEEGLAEYFAEGYVNRVYGLHLRSNTDPKIDALMRAVSTLLAKNEFVIKELRTHQPVISKIDERLLVEIAGIELNHAKFLCTDLQNYLQTPSPWSEYVANGA